MIHDNYIRYFSQSINDNWDLEALSDYQGKTVTYGQVGIQIEALHKIFLSAGVKEQDKIALIGNNSVNWAVTYLAAISYGAVIVPILNDFQAEDIHHIINHSDAVLFFLSQYHYDLVDEDQMPQLMALINLENFQILFERRKQAKDSLNRLSETLIASGSRLPEKRKISLNFIENDKLAAIVYTSGTTGLSKGVMLSHNCMLANLLYARENMPLVVSNKILSFLPLAHAYGCAFEFLFPFTVGCHITFLGKIPSPKVIVKAFSEIRPELILSVPLIIEKIYRKQLKPQISKEPLKTMLKLPVLNTMIANKINDKLSTAFGNNFKELVLGGAAFAPEVEAFLRKIKFHYTVGYGMTECGPLISYAGWRDFKQASVGRVVNWLEVKIDSPQPDKVIGEIMVRGESIMDGYYKNEQATAETIEKDGWMHTGDLGIIDSDGFIFIKGRKKNMILGPSGINIYPEEIEARLNNLPYILESLVIEQDNKIVALVYPDFEKTDARDISDPQILTLMQENLIEINKKLPAYSRISQIKMIPEEFVKTPTNKIKRYLYTSI
ncbi:MAG: AMP-binding protein [Candidatus Cloacimonetes bacterium]|nr:AMP-binding protein [Candidatus Cloacimonadota bacterium]